MQCLNVTMNKVYTSVALVLLVPFLLFLTFIKGPNNHFIENEGKSNELLADEGVNERVGERVDEMVNNYANEVDISQKTSDLQCNCDCDKSLITDQSFGELLSEEQSEKSKNLNINSDNDLVSTESKSTNPTIFVITPTYTRPTQMADMTRLSQTLSLVKNLFWIVSEDAKIRSEQVSELLNRSHIPYAHLLGPRPPTHLDRRSGRGVSNRLKALEYLREVYTNTTKQGVIYFADDDNAYDIRIFEEIRNTKKVSMFPVGLIAKIGLSTPIVSRQSAKIIGFHDPYISRRKYAVDMAGFAVNLQLFLTKPKATMPYKVGYEEDYFIKSLGIKLQDLEPKANNCTQVLVWHTKTSSGIGPNYDFLTKHKGYNETNLPLLYDNVIPKM